LKCAMASVVSGSAQPRISSLGCALELAEAARAGRLRVEHASAIQGESLAVIAGLRLEPFVG